MKSEPSYPSDRCNCPNPCLIARKNKIEKQN
jgi:hypothetical protein